MTDLCVDTMSTQQTFVTSELGEFCSLMRKVDTHEWHVPEVGVKSEGFGGGQLGRIQDSVKGGSSGGS